MIRRRDKPDGLPFRVYERKGARVYSIGYKLPNGKWAFRYSCPADDAAQIAEHRRRAITAAAQIGAGVSATGATEDLIDAWFKSQDAMPAGDPNRRDRPAPKHSIDAGCGLFRYSKILTNRPSICKASKSLIPNF